MRHIALQETEQPCCQKRKQMACIRGESDRARDEGEIGRELRAAADYDAPRGGIPMSWWS